MLHILRSQNLAPLTAYITALYCRSLIYHKNRDVCKKLGRNILKIYWAMAILSLKEIRNRIGSEERGWLEGV